MTGASSTEAYEVLFSRLQAIIARLESGDLPLADSLALYEEGVALSASCQHLLDAAVLRVRELQQQDAGG
ncbi:MAG TPA: exodeoxyribonuclease VII small subunit [Roseiflexaceae bacterium]|nr:exodeoxyribonuclease VII small subunit [Roseiflexaceae bacterium]HMP41252.1 exodeoxyribonuclease VII small subunit [Roseiflexaceae bacterium]